MEARDFPIAAVISITDGHLVCEIGGVHELLDWMTGESLMTHQLPRASRECEPFLRAQHPELAAVRVPEGTDAWDKVEAFLRPLRETLGATVAVRPLPPAEHTSIDPIDELSMMRPDVPIIAIAVEKEDES